MDHFEKNLSLEVEYLREAHPELFEHPEIKEDEVYLTNQSENKDLKIDYNSLRYGKLAYDKNGNVIEGFRPVFVNINEYIPHYSKRTESEQ